MTECLQRYQLLELYTIQQVSIETKLKLLKDFQLEADVRINYETKLEELFLETQLDAFVRHFEGNCLFPLSKQILDDLLPENRKSLQEKLDLWSLQSLNDAQSLSLDNLHEMCKVLYEYLQESSKKILWGEQLEKYTLQVCLCVCLCL
jgi:hypothetical protein